MCTRKPCRINSHGPKVAPKSVLQAPYTVVQPSEEHDLWSNKANA
jgi:hypothetical protein